MRSRILDIAHESRPYDDENVLVFYDGPVVFWLPASGERLLAVGIPMEFGPHPFLVAALSETLASDLLGNRVTARAAVLLASDWYLMRDYGAETLSLDPVANVPAEWLPGDVTLAPPAPVTIA